MAAIITAHMANMIAAWPAVHGPELMGISMPSISSMVPAPLSNQAQLAAATSSTHATTMARSRRNAMSANALMQRGGQATTPSGVCTTWAMVLWLPLVSNAMAPLLEMLALATSPKRCSKPSGQTTWMR